MLTNIDHQQLEKTLAKLEALFIAKDFRGIESFTMGRRLSAEEISNAVSEYPDELVGFNRASLDIVAVQNLSPSRWSVNIRFKTMAGDSDLTVTMFMQGGPESHLYNTEILDIHVL